MKNAFAVIVIAGLSALVSAPSQADRPGQYQTFNKVYTRGSLNVNMCTSKGSDCHLRPAPPMMHPLPQPPVQPAPANTAPAPATLNQMLFNKIE